MTHKEHRPGISDASCVVRNLKLAGAKDRDIGAAIREIDEMAGIDEVSVDEKTGGLHVAYDAGRLSIDGIETVLASHGIGISRDWWTRFKERQYRFVDKNVKDNAAYVPSCCSKLPPGAGGK